MAIVGDRIEHEILVEASPHEVFPYFTDPALMVRWMGRTAKLDARPGGAFQVEINDTSTAAGEFVVVEPPDRVVMSWGWLGEEGVPPGSTTLEVTLALVEGGTRVRLVHRDLPEPAWARHDHGWEHYVRRLATVATGGDPGPDAFATAG